MKRELSSFDIMALLHEIKQEVVSSIIDNIYQINLSTLLLKLHKIGHVDRWLIIEAGVRFNLTSYSFEKPKSPPTFCRALRKYIKRGKITDLFQREFERIITFKIEGKTGIYFLTCEFFREGNVILTDSEGTILHALHFRRMRDRNIIRGEKLLPPPTSGLNPQDLTLDEFRRIRDLKGMPLVRGLIKTVSIGGLYAEEAIERAQLDKNRPCEELSDEEVMKLLDALREIIKEVYEEPEPQIVLDEDGRYLDVVPVSLRRYSNFRKMFFESFNEAIDEYYSKRFLDVTSTEAVEDVEKEISKYQAIIKKQKADMERLKENIEEYRRIGDLIHVHANEIIHLKEIIRNYRDKGYSWEETANLLLKRKKSAESPYKYFQSVTPEKKTLKIEIDGLTAQLSLEESVYKDADSYYKRAKRLEGKLEGLRKAIEDMKRKIDDLRESREAVKKAPKIRVRRERLWYEKYHWFFSSEGFLVLGGRDAKTNEILIKKYLEPKDLVFHAEVFGAPIVIIKSGGKTPSEKTIKEAAEFAASYSRAWREGLRSVDVYWVHPDQVSLSPPSGQYLRRGAFIIKGEKNYLRDVPLKVAIGVLLEDGEVRVIGGPRSAVAEKTEYFVEVVPGRLKSGALAKKIKDRLMRLLSSDDRALVEDIPIEEIQRFIPPGGGELIITE